MSFTSLALVLSLLETVASHAAVDPHSLVLNGLALNPLPNDALANSMTSFK